MKTLSAYILENSKNSILEAKKVTAQELGSKCQSYAYNYLKQWALGGFESKDDCNDIETIDDSDLLDACNLVIKLFGKDTDVKKAAFKLGEEYEKAIRQNLSKKEIEEEYKTLEDVFSKRRLQIIVYGFSLSRSSKVDVVAECLRQLMSWCYNKDKERIEDIWPSNK